MRRTGVLLQRSYKLSSSDTNLSCLKDCFRHFFGALRMLVINSMFVYEAFPKKQQRHIKHLREMNSFLFFKFLRHRIIMCMLGGRMGHSKMHQGGSFLFLDRFEQPINATFRHETHSETFKFICAHSISI